MGRSISPCSYCNDDWDDAHWMFDDTFDLPHGMCQREWRATTTKQQRKMFKELLAAVWEEIEYRSQVAAMRMRSSV